MTALSKCRPSRALTLSALGLSSPVYAEVAGNGREDALVERMVAYWQRAIEGVLPDAPDLIVLPEMCDRFEQAPAERTLGLRDKMQERMRDALGKIAREKGTHIVYAGAVPGTGGQWHNAAILIDREGRELGCYAKNYLTPNELANGLAPGRAPLVIDCDFGRVGFAICFDLNFTALLDAYRPLSPDLMVFPSRYHGGIMQAYWAYQCRAHLVACTGMPSITSDIWSPVGRRLAASTNYFPHVTTTVNLDCAVVHLDFHWEKLASLKKHYGRFVKIDDPGKLGAVLVSSDHPEASARDMLAEFEIETLDTYLDRAVRLNRSHTPVSRADD